MDYRILGPLQALDGDRALALGGPRQRAVLALLLLHANEAVSSEVIVHELWGAEPPRTAAKALQNCVSALRKALPVGVETLRSVRGGYALRVSPGELDRDRFEALLAEGRALQAEGALGLHAHLVPELEALASRHPLRERLRGQLMLALYRSGRQAEALAVYRNARSALLGELGIEPGRDLQDLERGILAQDTALDSAPTAAAAPARRGASRAGRRATPPLVGRDDELELLEAGLEDALAGRGRLFVVVGGPGTGKTSLADAIASRAKARGASILWGRGWHGGGAPAYWPWRQAIRDAGQKLPQPPPEDDDAARFRFFEVVTELIRSEATQRPQLLVLDDLQSADEGSLLLLEFFASELPEMAALVVALARDDTPRLDELARYATRTLRLSRQS